MKKTVTEARAELASAGLEVDEIEEIVATRLAKGTIVADGGDEREEGVARLDAAAEAFRLRKAKSKKDDERKKDATDEEFDFEEIDIDSLGDDDDDELGNGDLTKAYAEAADLLKAEIRDAVEDAIRPMLAKAVRDLADKVKSVDDGLTLIGDLVSAHGELAKGNRSSSEYRELKGAIERLEKAIKGPRGDFRGVQAGDVEVIHHPGDVSTASSASPADLYKGATDFLDAQRVKYQRKGGSEADNILKSIAEGLGAPTFEGRVEAARALGFTG